MRVLPERSCRIRRTRHWIRRARHWIRRTRHAVQSRAATHAPCHRPARAAGRSPGYVAARPYATATCTPETQAVRRSRPRAGEGCGMSRPDPRRRSAPETQVARLLGGSGVLVRALAAGAA
ncbi:hypothetical protein GCM10018785_08650 [Streptomyces longispororuber]|uniref:Uncharacterized protein n=1 Tax=Streptomyces longispororuber TaxID=68230 RepID=A0A919DGM5_9ACTN|nr:hypothetical protein GCM10018785_08650 [Streptomyces longispororuber]